MNAIVEVATAEVVADAAETLVIATAPVLLEVVTPNKVATSTKRVLSIAGTSISAVAPDNFNYLGGLANAA